jgi:hypothetical protein
MIAYDDNTSLDTYRRRLSASLRGTCDLATHATVTLKPTPIKRPPDPQRPFVFNPAARVSFCIIFASPTHILGLSARTDALQTSISPRKPARLIAGRKKSADETRNLENARAQLWHARGETLITSDTINLDRVSRAWSREGKSRKGIEASNKIKINHRQRDGNARARVNFGRTSKSDIVRE